MDRKNLIHRAPAYFSIAYYGFLALYSLYELFFGGEYISIIVIAPLFYTLLIMAGLLLILPIFDIFQSLFKKRCLGEYPEIGEFLQHLESVPRSFGAATFLIGIAAGLAFASLTAPERTQLFEPIAWLFFFLSFMDVVFNTFVYNRQGRSIRPTYWLNKLFHAYPIAKAALIILILGPCILFISVFSVLAFASNPQHLPYLAFLFLFPATILTVLISERLRKKAKDPFLLIPIAILLLIGITLLFSGISLAFLRVLQQSMTSPLGPRVFLKLFAVVFFPPYYGFLAWVRWNEIVQFGKQGNEILE